MTASPLARAGRNLARKSLGELGGRALFALLFLYAARALGPADFGRYAFASSLAGLAFIGMDLGLNTLLVRDGARDRARVPELFGTMLWLKLALALLVLGLIYLICHLAGYPPEQTGVVMLVSLGLFFWGLFELGAAGLSALERMDREAVIRSAARLAALILAGGALLGGAGLWGFLAGLALANALAAVWSLSCLGRLAGFAARLAAGRLAGLLREALPMAFLNIFTLVYMRVDLVMLEAMGVPFAEIGWYGAGVRVVDALGMVPALVIGSLLPVLSSLAGDRAGLLALYRQGQRLLLGLAFPAAAGLLVLRKPIAELIFGQGFAGTAQSFLWLAPLLLFQFPNQLQLNLLTVLGRQGQAARAAGAGAVCNVLLNLASIPAFGFMGAAAATLATEVLLFWLAGRFLRRELGEAGLGGLVWRPLLAAGSMALGLAFTPEWSLLIMVPVGAAIYGLMMLALGGVRLEELGRLARALGLRHR